MVDRERLLDLLAEWEEQRQHGHAPDPTRLCPDDPTLQAELARQVQRRLRIHAAIEPGTPDVPPLPALPGYEVEAVLGHGGMGIVYRARQAALGRQVAVKMMAGPPGADSAQRFRAEARALAALQHPHVVQVFEAGQADGRPYLVMEFAPGGSLADLLRGRPLGWRRAAELCATLATAVQYAHERGIVHRDLKPANVLLDADGRPKVADFGLAKLLGVEGGRTVSGAVVGTPSYMAPEQAGGRKDVGPAADIWALGAILYECLTGRPPFQADSAIQTLLLVAGHEPVPPTRLNPSVPADLETVCLKCLQKQPGDRYRTAGEVAEDLKRVLAGEPTAARPPSRVDRVTRVLRRARFDHNGFRAWVPLSMLLAPIPLSAAAAATALFAGRPDGPYWMIGIVAAAVIGTQAALFYGNRRVLEAVAEAERDRYTSLWNGVIVAMLAVLAIVWLTTPAGQPDRLLVVCPLWIALGGLAFAAQAGDAGGAYLFSAYAFATALLAAWLLPWAPLITGGFVTLNLLLVIVFLWVIGPDEQK
jgi:hypothetical protein